MGTVLGIAAASGVGCTTSYYNRVDVHGAFLRHTVRDESAKAGLVAPAWTVEPIDAGPNDAGPPPDDAVVPAVIEAPPPSSASSAPETAAPESSCSMTNAISPAGRGLFLMAIALALASVRRRLDSR